MPHISLSANTRTRTHTHAHTHTHHPSIHWWRQSCHARPWPAHREQFGNLCLTQGHLDMQSGGANNRDNWSTGSTAWAAVIIPGAAENKRLLSDLLCKKCISYWKTIFFFSMHFFFQALWVFINCRKNILHGESWHMAHCFASGWTVLFLKSLL